MVVLGWPLEVNPDNVMKIIRVLNFLCFNIPVLLLCSCNGDSSNDPTTPEPSPPLIKGHFPVGAGPGTIVKITGSQFGAKQQNNKVLVSGVTARIEKWEDTEVAFTMPDKFSETRVTIELEVSEKMFYVGEIFAWRPGVIHLVADGSHPAWSPDGKHIIYSKRIQGSKGPYDLFMLSVDGGDPIQLTNTVYDEIEPDIQPGSGYLTYRMNGDDSGAISNDWRICVASGPSTAPSEGSFHNILYDDGALNNSGLPLWDFNPSWNRSPAVVEMAFASEIKGRGSVIKVVKSGVISELISGYKPRFNPMDGNWITYVDIGIINPYIYKINITDGSGPVLLSDNELVTGVGDWGINGKILYERGDFSGDIWLMDDDGQNQRSLSEINTVDLENQPRWSPDGKRIAYFSHRAGGSAIGIFIYDTTK